MIVITNPDTYKLRQTERKIREKTDSGIVEQLYKKTKAHTTQTANM